MAINEEAFAKAIAAFDAEAVGVIGRKGSALRAALAAYDELTRDAVRDAALDEAADKCDSLEPYVSECSDGQLRRFEPTAMDCADEIRGMKSEYK